MTYQSPCSNRLPKVVQDPLPSYYCRASPCRGDLGTRIYCLWGLQQLYTQVFAVKFAFQGILHQIVTFLMLLYGEFDNMKTAFMTCCSLLLYFFCQSF
jgi:hypothetical protein